MGCCLGLRNNLLSNKDIIIDINESERREIIVKSSKDYIEKENNYNKSNRKKSVISTKIADTSLMDNSRPPKKREKIINTYNKRIKDTTKILQLIAISEVKNIHKFFMLK